MEISQIIAYCNQGTITECFQAIKELSNEERECLMRAFEFNPDNLFNENLLVALNYLIK